MSKNYQIDERGQIIRPSHGEPSPPRSVPSAPRPVQRYVEPRTTRTTTSTNSAIWVFVILGVIGLIWLLGYISKSSNKSTYYTPPNTQSIVSPVRIQQAVICLNVENREPQYSGISFDENVKQVYCWTKVSNANGRYINHTYYHEGRWSHNERLYIGGNSQWRTWSKKTVLPGNWSVKITDDAGNLLTELSFRVSQKYLQQNPVVTRSFKRKVIFKGPHNRQLVFNEPNTSSTPVGSVNFNDEFWLLEKSKDGQWAKISLTNGKTGWMKLFYSNFETGRHVSIVLQYL